RSRALLPLIGAHVPASHSITVPPPYSPLGMAPSNSAYSRGWSSVRTARRLMSGSGEGPLVTAQLLSTPSISSRKSQWSRRAACFWTRKRFPPLADLPLPLPEGSAVLVKSRFCRYSFSLSARAIALGPLAFSGGFAGRALGRRLVFLHRFLERSHKVDNVRSAALRGFFHIFQDAGFLAL